MIITKFEFDFIPHLKFSKDISRNENQNKCFILSTSCFLSNF